MINIFQSLEKDPKYEELYPILSFSFKEMKNKLSDILVEVDQLRIDSHNNHKKNEVIISIANIEL